MIVRSITQLPEEKDNFLSGRMEMSIPNSTYAGLYSSKQVRYSNVLSNIQSITTDAIVKKYLLDIEPGSPISLKSLYNAVNEISVEDSTFYGVKTFDTWPTVHKDFPTEFSDDDVVKYGDEGEYILPNVKKVKQIVDDNVIFMSTTSSIVAEGNPLPHHKDGPTDYNTYVPEALDFDNTIGKQHFYFWKIDGGQDDSSKANYDAYSGSHDGYEEMRDTGNLVVWGWLADNPFNPPEPYKCWVRLCAKIKCENGDDTHYDIPIAVRPWIRGEYASTLQYVGFNLPVKKGLRIKVMTGFPVYASNSAMQETGSMTFMDKSIPNAFYGYIIK